MYYSIDRKLMTGENDDRQARLSIGRRFLAG